jgi:HEAT repeat protein
LEDFAACKRVDYSTAFQNIGTNGISYAVRKLEHDHTRWRLKYRELWSKSPQFLKKILPELNPPMETVHLANVFYYSGTNAIPQELQLMKHKNPLVREAACWGMVSMRKESSAAIQAIPALIEALGDPEDKVRFCSALAIIEMGPDASNAVPALTAIVANTGTGPKTNSLFYLRAVAARALGKIGPAALSTIPVLKSTTLEHNSYLRGHAAVAIWRINGDVDTALPVLLQEMPSTVEDSKWDWIIALGEMGPQAKEALPQLARELKQDRNGWVLDYVTNALLKIDPETAATLGVKSAK